MFKYLNYKKLNNIEFGASMASNKVLSALTKEIVDTYKLIDIKESIFNDLVIINGLAVLNRYGYDINKSIGDFNYENTNYSKLQIVVFSDTYLSIIEHYSDFEENKLTKQQNNTLDLLRSYLRKNKKLLKTKETYFLKNFYFAYHDQESEDHYGQLLNQILAF